MKFGRNLPRNQVPEWAANYINYKKLKKLIKNASPQDTEGQEDQQEEEQGEPDLAGTEGQTCPFGIAHEI